MNPLVQSTKQLVEELILSPPVTREDMAQAEAMLPFSLPPLLRELYLEVADGEVGPGGGLMGLLTSHLTQDCDDPAVVATYLLWSATPDDTGLPWPKFYLPITHEGCQVYNCVDCSTAEYAVFCFDPSDDPEFGPASFHLICSSLEDWWRAWIALESQAG